MRTQKTGLNKMKNRNNLLNNFSEEREKIFVANSKINFTIYLQYTHFARYIPYDFHKLVAEHCEKVERGDIKRLIITMPPQHGKSMTVSESFPSWFIGRDPNRRVILTSYGNRFANKFGRKNREKIDHFGEKIFGIKIHPKNAAVSNWSVVKPISKNSYRKLPGGIISSSIGGSITGEGADLLIVDDPYKNKEEAYSDTYREKVWGEWQSTLLDRLSAEGRVIIIQTRWHHDDLAGRLIDEEGLKEDGGKWHLLRIPCEAEENDILGREPGESLWPEFGKDKQWMDEKKIAVGSVTWGAKFQQDPSPEEGNIIKKAWWQYYDVRPTYYDELIQSWDMSFKDKKDSSYVVGQIWGRVGANAYLVDQIREQLEFTDTIKAVKSMTSKWPNAKAKYVEDKANGPAVISALKDRIPGIMPIQTGTDSKEARLRAVSPFIESGNVYLPNKPLAPWIDSYIEEFKKFPVGKHDDQVDGTSQALDKLLGDANKSIIDMM